MAIFFLHFFYIKLSITRAPNITLETTVFKKKICEDIETRASN